MIERVLLIVNSSSGTGSAPSLPARLLAELRQAAGPVRELELACVRDHPSARRAASAYLGASNRPAALIVGGGGGTLRAAVEGACDWAGGEVPGPDRVVLGALRMGSGNVAARRLGIARDPLTGIAQLGAALRAGRTARCSVLRCRFGRPSGGEDMRCAVTMCGLGQWGRCSGDLARWRRRMPAGRAALAAITGLERLNHLEYAWAAGVRLVEAAVRPGACDDVEVALGGRIERCRLLAGVVMNMPIPGMPFEPRLAPGEIAAAALLVPRGRTPRRLRLGPGEPLRIRLLERRPVEFFLDEDPELALGAITLDVAGAMSFLAAESMEVAA